MNNTRYLESIRKEVLSQYDQKKNDRQRAKEQLAHQKEIDVDNQVVWPFFCLNCNEDFYQHAIKVQVGDIAWYRTFHNCGNECIRRITNRPDDEFYNLSENLRKERQMYEDDMLSPMYNRFSVLYGREIDRQIEAENLQAEERLFEKYSIEGAPSFTKRVSHLESSG